MGIQMKFRHHSPFSFGRKGWGIEGLQRKRGWGVKRFTKKESIIWTEYAEKKKVCYDKRDIE